jgi:hypothetical protein
MVGAEESLLVRPAATRPGNRSRLMARFRVTPQNLCFESQNLQ